MAVLILKHRRLAQLAHVLARGVRDQELEATVALTVIKHELRKLNTNKTMGLPRRSLAAQASVEKHAPSKPPQNGSGEALHADHVYPPVTRTLHDLVTVELWEAALPRLTEVVCVTAVENYELQRIEKDGISGPEKYDRAGVRFTRQLAGRTQRAEQTQVASCGVAARRVPDATVLGAALRHLA